MKVKQKRRAKSLTVLTCKCQRNHSNTEMGPLRATIIVKDPFSGQEYVDESVINKIAKVYLPSAAKTSPMSNCVLGPQSNTNCFSYIPAHWQNPPCWDQLASEWSEESFEEQHRLLGPSDSERCNVKKFVQKHYSLWPRGVKYRQL